MTAVAQAGSAPVHEFNVAYSNLPATPPPATVSAAPGAVMTQPSNLARFATTQFAFEGGDPVIDLPTVVLEEQVAGQWQPMRRANGKPLAFFYEYWLDYQLVNGAHRYTVHFEPAKDFPVGRYRFAVQGRAQRAPGPSNYTAASSAFSVQAANTLLLSAALRSGNSVAVTLAYAAVPDNYRLIDPNGPTDQPVPVRSGRVRFLHANGEVLSRLPELSTDGNNQTTATYRADVPDNGRLEVLASDAWGNFAVSEAMP